MCGISGIINKSNEQVSRESLTSMNNLVRHRGPDAEGMNRFHHPKVGAQCSQAREFEAEMN